MSHSGVNIEKAENSFNELSRQLTQGTIVDDREHGDEDTRAPTAVENRTMGDLEKGGADLEQPFDLREFLTSSNDANERAGVKHKHVGVIWEDFHVDVLGGSDFKVGVKASLARPSLNHRIGKYTAIRANLRRSVNWRETRVL
jgi:ATP-binding cassette subfamily G (WHITE) protein 2 (SNQ2)